MNIENPTNISEKISSKGVVTVKIEFLNNEKENIVFSFNNATMRRGKYATAASIANEIGDSFNLYVARMLFGDGGTSEGTVKKVDENRNGLFGITRASKNVISQIDPNNPAKVYFTAVLGYSDANGYALNEMALQLANGDLYAMATFADLNKTESMQIIWNWSVEF